MALQINLTDEHTGLVVNNCYVRILKVNYDKEAIIDIQVGFWVSQNARNDNRSALTYRGYEVPYADNGTSLASLYTYLKTLPEFANAQDV